MTLKAALANVVLAGFTLDGGAEHESFAAETISERLALLMAIDRVDLSTVTTMLEANPALAKVRYYTEDSPATGASFLTRNMDPWVQWTARASRRQFEDSAAPDRERRRHRGGSVATRWSSGGRPLHIAANHDNVGVARLLLEAGADPQRTGQGPAAARVERRARRARWPQPAAVLMDGGAEYNLLHLGALQAARPARIRAGRADQRPVSRVRCRGRRACCTGQCGTTFPTWLRGFSNAVADPDLVDANGMTPKQVAVTADRSDAVRELLGLEPATAP